MQSEQANVREGERGADLERQRRGGLAMLAAILLPTLSGLVASALLYVEYNRGGLCEAGGGCEQVKATSLASIAGIQTPLIGIAGFALLGVLTLARGPIARTAHLLIAIAGACFAAYLLYYQGHVVGAFCKFCVIADISMIAVAVAAGIRTMAAWDTGSRGEVLGGGGALALALGVPLLIGFSGGPKQVSEGTPKPIADEIAKTPRGMVTVVDFVDFECPWCRKNHKGLGPMLAKYRDKVRLVRVEVPLAMHPHAKDAARAECCAEKLGKGDEMADALFISEDLTPEGNEKVAESVGLPLEAYRACLKDPATDAKIDADVEIYKGSNCQGLPTIYVGDQKVEGAREPAMWESVMSAAVDNAS